MTKPRKIIWGLVFFIIILVVLYKYKYDLKEFWVTRNYIFWSENVEIELSDFENDISHNSNSNIVYYNGFYIKSNDREDVYVKSFFDKSKSCAKDTSKYYFDKSIKLQKIRFNLFEVYARKFNKEIDKLKLDKSKTFNDLENVGESLYKELGVLLNEIDNNQINIYTKIKKWRPKVNEMLNKNEE